jgi:hypothetical protein
MLRPVDKSPTPQATAQVRSTPYPLQTLALQYQLTPNSRQLTTISS